MKESRLQRAIGAVNRALSAVDEEIARHERGEGGISDADELRAMRKQLLIIQRQLSGQLPPVQHRVRGLGHVIIDTWPLGTELGNLIHRAERAYLELP